MMYLFIHLLFSLLTYYKYKNEKENICIENFFSSPLFPLFVKTDAIMIRLNIKMYIYCLFPNRLTYIQGYFTLFIRF